jgi:hypothetical protein
MMILGWLVALFVSMGAVGPASAQCATVNCTVSVTDTQRTVTSAYTVGQSSNDDCGIHLMAGGGAVYAITATAASGYTCSGGGNYVVKITNTDTSFAKIMAITGLLTGTNPNVLLPGQTEEITSNGTNWIITKGALSNAPTIDVDNGAGTDSTSCGTGTGASACKSIGQGITNAYAMTTASAVTLSVADGTYSTSTNTVTGQSPGRPILITINGDSGTPSNVVVDGGGGTACFEALGYGQMLVENLQVQNCALEIASTDVFTYAAVGNVVFGACSSASSGVQMYASRFGYVQIVAPYTITASTNCSSHMQASHHGNFRAATGGGTVGNIINNLSYSQAFADAEELGDLTFTTYSASPFALNGHTVTGPQWQVSSGGMMQTLVQGPGFFPGSTNGTLIGDGSFNGSTHVGTSINTGGGTSPTITGNDFDGMVTEGAGSTGIVIAFGWPFDSAPVCTVIYGAGGVAAPASVVYTTSTSALGITHAAGASSFAYHCHGG